MNIRHFYRTCSRGTAWGLLFAALAVFPAGGAAGAGPVVLFDEAHDQRFTVASGGDLGLGGFADLIKEKGGEVRPLRDLTGKTSLAGAKALVVAGPFAPFAAEEVAALKEFLEGGGRLCVTVHIPQPVTGLLDALHVAVSRGVVHELENIIGDNPLDFHVRRFGHHALTEGIESFAVYGSWAVKNRDERARLIALTGPKAWMDLNRSRRYEGGEPVERFGIVAAGEVGKGAFLVFADDAIFQDRFLTGNNRKLAENLAAWLVE